jgi:hypothetical protein
MSSPETANDTTPGDDDAESPYEITHHALAGGMLCVLAVILVAVILTHTSSHGSNDLPAGVTPTSQLSASRVTPTTRVPSAAVVHKLTPTTAASLPTVAPTTVPAPVVQVQAPARQAPVVQVQTQVTQPPTTQPQTPQTPQPPTPPTTQPQPVSVPYTLPPVTTPDTVVVPFVSTSISIGIG